MVIEPPEKTSKDYIFLFSIKGTKTLSKYVHRTIVSEKE